MLEYAKITQMIRQKQYILCFKVNETFWILFHTAKHYLPTILQSYCNYLLKIGRMGEEQVVYEQLTLSDFKKWSSAALKAHSQVWEHFWKLKPFKNDEKCFSLQILVSFSWYLNFCLEFSVMSKNSWIRKIRLISKFIMPQPG